MQKLTTGTDISSTKMIYKPYHTYERGMSVTEVVFFLFALGIFIKLAIAIIPAQVGDYQFTKIVAHELHRSNVEGHSANQFMESLRKQLTINANYDTVPSEMITITKSKPGSLAVHKDYEVINNFIGNVDILNRFEGEIVAEEGS